MTKHSYEDTITTLNKSLFKSEVLLYGKYFYYTNLKSSDYSHITSNETLAEKRTLVILEFSLVASCYYFYHSFRRGSREDSYLLM